MHVELLFRVKVVTDRAIRGITAVEGSFYNPMYSDYQNGPI